MSYDHWKQTPLEECCPGLSARSARVGRTLFRCDDCGAVGDEGYISDPLAQKVYCGGCGRSREKRLMDAFMRKEGAA